LGQLLIFYAQLVVDAHVLCSESITFYALLMSCDSFGLKFCQFFCENSAKCFLELRVFIAILSLACSHVI
ncbi:hypothetical protein, partial [Enterobacter cloacae complex sp. 4DZ1-17B1]|uniref:hypothetical protein n=1 Tax=Enterobacter cloacae complex sp. 4DZ1-17B1 TaxID=2511991 RepID=UPI001CA53B21